MRMIFAAALALAATAAQAQSVPLVAVPTPLLNAIYSHLMTGGTYSAGIELARELHDLTASKAPEAPPKQPDAPDPKGK